MFCRFSLSRRLCTKLGNFIYFYFGQEYGWIRNVFTQTHVISETISYTSITKSENNKKRTRPAALTDLSKSPKKNDTTTTEGAYNTHRHYLYERGGWLETASKFDVLTGVVRRGPRACATGDRAPHETGAERPESAPILSNLTSLFNI